MCTAATSQFARKCATYLTPSKEYYQGVGAFIDELSRFCSVTDNFTGVMNYGSEIVFKVSSMAGHPISEANFFADRFMEARLLNAAVRVIPCVESVVTGKIFFKQNHDGTLTNDLGEKEWREPLHILASISLIVARLLSPFCYAFRLLRQHGGHDSLKKFAEPINVAMCCSFTLTGVVSSVQTVKELFDAKAIKNQLDRQKAIKNCIIDLGINTLEFLAMPWENSLVSMDGHVFVNFFGSCIGFAARGCDLVKQVVRFQNAVSEANQAGAKRADVMDALYVVD